MMSREIKAIVFTEVPARLEVADAWREPSGDEFVELQIGTPARLGVIALRLPDFLEMMPALKALARRLAAR